MTPGERTGKFRIGKDDLVVDVNGDSNISVEDYAVAMVDELEQKKHHKERFTIGLNKAISEKDFFKFQNRINAGK